jgi:putative transposase
VTPAVERETVAHLKIEHEMSERRACKFLQYCRMIVRYASVRVDDSNLRERMKAIAHERVALAIGASMCRCVARG